MLNQEQIELINQEIDGANTAEQSAAFRALVEQNPEARTLAAELRSVALTLDRVGQRDPPPRLKQAILAALPSRGQPRATWWDILSDPVKTILEGGRQMTRKQIFIGGAGVAAVVIIVAGVLTGFPPAFNKAGTIGGIGGVEQAARYRGRAMTAADVTLKNPEIQALLQNDQVLQLVKSDAFREVMQNASFHTLQASAAYREVMASAAYQQLQANTAFRDLQANAAYQQLQANAAFRDLQAQGAFRDVQSAQVMQQLQANAAYREIQASAAYQQLQANQAFRELQANAAYRDIQANAAWQQLQSNQAFRDLQANGAFQQLQASAAFQQLQASETFRALSQNAALSQVFMQQVGQTTR